MALADTAIQRHLEDLAVRKVIVVADRIINIVAGPAR
jgi:leucyl-tRNA synthetase